MYTITSKGYFGNELQEFFSSLLHMMGLGKDDQIAAVFCNFRLQAQCGMSCRELMEFRNKDMKNGLKL